MIKQAPICYFPTTVALVDDNENYLSTLRLKLDPSKALYTFHTDAKKAYEYLKEAATPPDFLKRCVNQEIDTMRGHRTIDINLYPIRESVYNPDRFQQLSVLVIDQEMPGMKGLEICEKLKGTPIRKILLTGEVKDERAIQAFNTGVIDQFIPKNADNFYELLNNTISAQQKIFIESVTGSVSSGLTQMRQGYSPSCLLDPKFIELQEKLVKENNVCEYYLSDDNGSYLFLDQKGTPSWLVLKDTDEVEADYYLADDSDEPPSEDILLDLKEGKLVLHLFTEDEDKNVEPVDWKKYGLLHKAKVLKGETQKYHYAYVSDPDAHDIEREKIVSFNDARADQE